MTAIRLLTTGNVRKTTLIISITTIVATGKQQIDLSKNWLAEHENMNKDTRSSIVCFIKFCSLEQQITCLSITRNERFSPRNSR